MAASYGFSFHWAIDHITINYTVTGNPTGVFGGYARTVSGSPKKMEYYAYCGCTASYLGPTSNNGDYALSIDAYYYVNYIRDSPSDPLSPDTAEGAGPIGENAWDTLADGLSFANANGGSAVAKGSSIGLASAFSFSWTGPGSAYYTTGPQTGTQTFSFVKNTGTESGTHVAHILGGGGPIGSAAAATFVTGLGQTPNAGAFLEIRGDITLSTIDGNPVS